MQKLAEGFMKYEGEYFYEAKVSHQNLSYFWPPIFQNLYTLFRQRVRFKAAMVNEQREQNVGEFITKENVSLEKWPKLFSKLDAESQSPEKDKKNSKKIMLRVI